MLVAAPTNNFSGRGVYGPIGIVSGQDNGINTNNIVLNLRRGPIYIILVLVIL